MIDARSLARALGGEARGNRIVAPGPGHSARDRSLAILISATAPDGFVVHSHAGDDPILCKRYVRERAGVGEPLSRPQPAAPEPTDTERSEAARSIWRAASSPQGTPVERYLTSRGLALPDASIRWHAACPFGRRFVTGAMVALVTGIHDNRARAVHRTALTDDGRKAERGGHDRLSLGPVAGGAIKFAPVETVVGIGEGIETTLSLRLVPGLECLPVWSLISAGGLAAFPVLAGVEAVWIAQDNDDVGRRAAEEVAERWTDDGREAVIVSPVGPGDLNDMAQLREAAA